MIRLLLAVVIVLILWLLFFSSLRKRIRILVSGALLALVIIALYIENDANTAKTKNAKIEDVVSCGTKAKQTYRTNYDVIHCVRNTSARATIRRISLTTRVVVCPEGECKEIDSQEKTVSVNIAPNSEQEIVTNLAFDEAAALSQDHQKALVWTTDITQVWAVD